MLSTTSEYALRALARLAELPPGEAVQAHQLASDADIPANYLSKVLHSMRSIGILDAARGQGGGYRLARPANEIRLIEVVELFEGIRARPECFLGARHVCNDADPCSAHHMWRTVREKYIQFLEETTVAGISQRPGTRKSVRGAKQQAASPRKGGGKR